MTEDFNITGTWVNRLNGDKIMVRNTVIDGDDMIIFTSDGRQLKMSEFQDYIQLQNDKDHHDDSDVVLGDIMNMNNERRVVVSDNMSTVETMELYDGQPYAGPQLQTEKLQPQSNKPVNQNTLEPKNESSKLLHKLFEKIELNFDVNVDLNCDNFPVRELTMLQTIYDVDVDDISDYIIKNILTDDVFKSAVSTYIKNRLS